MAQTVPSSSNDTEIVITIDDTSPTITYRPSADTFSGPNLTAGWNPFYSETGFTPNPVTGEGMGTSLHVTSADGASLSLRWNGTAVSLFGFFPTSASGFPSSVSYSVALDGSATTNYASAFSPDSDPATSVLASFTNLTNGEHIVEVTMHDPNDLDDSSIILQFDRAVITSSLPAQAAKQSSNVTLVTSTLADELISFHGQWSFDSNLLPGQNVSFHTSSNIGDQASVQFNGTSVTLAGLTTPLSGAYNISLDNGPQETFFARSSFNLSSPTLLFFRTGLDPSVVHRLDVVNAGASSDAQDSLLIINSVNVTTVANNGSGAQPVRAMSSRRLSAGTIAALSVGIFLAMVALVVLSVCYVRRRRRERRRKQNFMVNPRVSNRRLSFLRPRRSTQSDTEKGRHKAEPSHGAVDIEILDISGRKQDDEEEEYDTHELEVPGGDDARERHASQNSDGSYSISLPELPSQSYTRVRSDGDSPSPTHMLASLSSTSHATPPPAHPPVIVHPASPGPPRSPKPRGPREMRSSTLGPALGPARGILKRVQTLPADVSMTLQPSSGAAGPSFFPPPGSSPLRVNFEEAPDEKESRPQRSSRSRSVASAISLSASLRNALHWGSHRAPETLSENVPTEGDARSYARYSFLDMDSSASQSSGSRSTRQSHTTSTRGSSRSRQISTSAESRGAQESSDSQDARNTNNRMSLALSMTMAGGPTSSHPSLSPNISFQAVPLPPPLTMPEPLTGADDVPQSVHPTDLAEMLPSPTDSIPLTVSDIHFRYSTQSSVDVSGAESHNGLSRTHPPMPGSSTLAPPLDTRPYIVQRLIGSPNVGPEPSTPYGQPRPLAPTASSSTVWSRPRAVRSRPSFSSFMPSRPTTREG